MSNSCKKDEKEESKKLVKGPGEKQISESTVRIHFQKVMHSCERTMDNTEILQPTKLEFRW